MPTAPAPRDEQDEQARRTDRDRQAHRERAERHREARKDPRRVKREPDSGTGARSRAAAYKKAD